MKNKSFPLTYGQFTPSEIDRMVRHPKFDEFIKELERRRQEYMREIEDPHRLAVTAKEPLAYVHRSGVLKYEIRRPRRDSDLPALVNYYLLSGIHESPESAWAEAKRLLDTD